MIATGKCSLGAIYKFIHIYIYSDHVGESEAKTGIMERKSWSDNLSQSFSITVYVPLVSTRSPSWRQKWNPWSKRPVGFGKRRCSWEGVGSNENLHEREEEASLAFMGTFFQHVMGYIYTKSSSCSLNKTSGDFSDSLKSLIDAVRHRLCLHHSCTFCCVHFFNSWIKRESRKKAQGEELRGVLQPWGNLDIDSTDLHCTAPPLSSLFTSSSTTWKKTQLSRQTCFLLHSSGWPKVVTSVLATRHPVPVIGAASITSLNVLVSDTW